MVTTRPVVEAERTSVSSSSGLIDAAAQLGGGGGVARRLHGIPFRDRTLLTERIATGNHSFARLLLGGRVMVLARQRASLRITEVPGATTVEVERGRVALTVDRENLHPEDLVEVRTPHAVVTVPGDTLIVEVAGAGSTFRVFGARVEVFALDPATGAAVGPPTSVAAEKVVTVGPSAPATDVAQR